MKKLIFINYDIFIKFFEPESKKEFEDIKQFFNDVVSSKVRAYTTTHCLIKLAELLESSGRWTREEIARNLELILLTPNIKINFRDVIESALEIYRHSNTSLLNAYHIAVMKRMKAQDCFTYDSYFKDYIKKTRGEER